MKRGAIPAGAAILGLSLAVFCVRKALPFMGSDGAGAMGATLPLLGAVAGLLLLCIPLARPVANAIGEAAASLFFSNRRFDRPQPAYGVPEGFAIRGQVEEALRLYREIAADHPEEVRPWLESMELAWHVLSDAERTRRLCEEGLARVPRDADRKRLLDFHEALAAGKLPNRWPHLRGRFSA